MKNDVVLSLTNGAIAGFEAFLNYDMSCLERESVSINGLEDDINVKENTQMKQKNLFNLRVDQPVEKIKYKNSLIAESENNIVFSIDPNLLSTELRNELFKFFKPNFEKEREIYFRYF
jgi:hypothetical protein